MICMKRSILLFLVLYFYILLSPIFAQSGQKNVIFDGYLSYDGKSSEPKNVNILIAKSYVKPAEINAECFPCFGWDFSEDYNSWYLLFSKIDQSKDLWISVKNKLYPRYSNYDIGFRCTRDVLDSFRTTNL